MAGDPGGEGRKKGLAEIAQEAVDDSLGKGFKRVLSFSSAIRVGNQAALYSQANKVHKCGRISKVQDKVITVEGELGGEIDYNNLDFTKELLFIKTS